MQIKAATSIKIPLTKGKFAIIDAGDFDLISKYKWYCNKDGYALTTTGSTGTRMHRLILGANKKEICDHVNLNKLDNRKSNLRICTQKENLRNRSKNKNNSSKFKGVFWHSTAKKWMVQIYADKFIYLGLFTNKKKAAFAYNIAAKIYHGEFAYLNKI